MGTSADMAVRYQGRDYFQHTSYDGYTSNIMANVVSTMAACGIQALRDRMSQAGAPMTEDDEPEDEVQIDRRAMGNAYLSACQQRGKAPVGLEAAMNYEYGNPDFTHGGMIALFAPEIEWHVGFCHSVEEAAVIVDLDKEVIVLPDWNRDIQPGSYDGGSLPTLATVPFSAIDDLDPEVLEYAFHNNEVEVDDEGVKPNAVNDLLERVRNGQVELPPKQEFDRSMGSLRGSIDRPGVHMLTGLLAPNGHAPFFQAVVDFFRSQQEEFPEFARQETLLTHPHPEDPRATVLFVDLRQSQGSGAGQMVQAVLSRLAPEVGMVYEVQGDGFSSSRSSHGMMSSVGGGFGEDFDQPWDANVIPADAKPVLMTDARSVALESADPALAKGGLQRAIFNLDGQAWSDIEAAGVVPPLTTEELGQVAGFAVFLSRMFEEGAPGSTSKRFNALSEGQRSALLEVMQPIDRHLFVPMVKQVDAAKSKRGPGV